jgi:hypothetical protein
MVCWAPPEVAKRKEAWDLLNHLKQYDPVPCLCRGDFNEIIDNSKECGAELIWKNSKEHWRNFILLIWGTQGPNLLKE